MQAQHYERLARETNARTKREYDEWLESYTPSQIRDANLARKKLRAMVANGSRWRSIKDERLVKTPSSPFVFYYAERHNSGDFRGTPVLQSSKEAGAEYKALPDSEKQVCPPHLKQRNIDTDLLQKYKDMAAKDSERYRRELMEVYGTESASEKAVSASAKAPGPTN